MKFADAAKAKNKGKMMKWEHYFDIYDFHFEKIQNEIQSVLEIGIAKGGSLFTWQEYFPNATISGIDIEVYCKEYEEGRIKVFLGSQADVEFIKAVNKETGPYDIIIDDGTHMMSHQILTFKTLFPLLKDGGTYVIEDWHTSYWPEYNDTGEKTVDFLKGLIDGLNFWAVEAAERKEHRDYFSQNITAINFYNGIVFIKKGKNQRGICNKF